MSVECPVCGHFSDVIYRCQQCGRDLVDEDSETTGREEV